MKKLLVLLGLGLVAKKVAGRRQVTTSVAPLDREMHRQGFPGGVRP